MFVYDVETLSTKENAVVLSFAILWFDDSIKCNSYHKLLDDTLFVKFSVEEQIKKYKRRLDQSTCNWWKEQSKPVKDKSLNPSPNDVSVIDGIKTIKKYISDHATKDDIVWTRGSLDQFVADDLCECVGEPPLFKYGQYRDVRTAIDIMKETSRRGYCTLPPWFDTNIVIKHDPVHDVVYDAIMLMDGI